MNKNAYLFLKKINKYIALIKKGIAAAEKIIKINFKYFLTKIIEIC